MIEELQSRFRDVQHILVPVLVFIFGVIVLMSWQLSAEGSMSEEQANQQNNAVNAASGETQIATFATGCFWCMEAIFQETPGVTASISGYAGGTEENPTYEEVVSQLTSHREGVRVEFDPAQVSYEELLGIFWRNIDPTDPGGQFVDRGFSYTTAVFYHDELQRELAEKTRAELAGDDRFDGKPIVTEILPYTTFYEAEEYHQDFYLKSRQRYQSYEIGSGRQQFEQKHWSEDQ